MLLCAFGERLQVTSSEVLMQKLWGCSAKSGYEMLNCGSMQMLDQEYIWRLGCSQDSNILMVGDMSLSLDGWGMIWRRQLRSRFAINPNNPQIIFFWLVRGHAKYGGSPLLALTFQTLPSRLETYWIGGHHFGSLSRQQVSPVLTLFLPWLVGGSGRSATHVFLPVCNLLQQMW